MEKKAEKKTSEMFTENINIGESINEATSSLMGIYKKQLDQAFGLYNNFFENIMGLAKTNSNQNLSYNDIFFW
ncbi:MAG: hypothetical protein Q8T03_11065 [Bacteroidota bacterium]|nr:hypothetical protein [Bacteroidota bacterium]